MKFPKHISMTLTHNDHALCYETAKQAIENENFGYKDWISEEQKQKAIETNECWVLQWYPETPVGFCTLSAADLDALLEFCK